MEKKKDDAVQNELETSRAGKYQNTLRRDMSPDTATKRSAAMNMSFNTLGSL